MGTELKIVNEQKFNILKSLYELKNIKEVQKSLKSWKEWTRSMKN